MSVYNIMDKDDNVEEERIITSLRGKKITVTVNSINSLLGISNPPPPAEIHYSNEEIFQLLRPDQPLSEPIGKLSFKPIEMPPIHRALWYIYSRNMVQKGKNFTHFTQKDYTLFASIIDKVPHNLGHWIFHEMKKYKLHSKPHSTIPFPNLISLILFSENVWYLEKEEKPTKIHEFDQHHLNMMKISFKEGSGQSKAPSHPIPSASQVQEAQSAPPPHTPSVSADLETKIQSMIDQAVNKIFDEMHLGHLALVKNQDRLDSKIESLYECYESHTEILTQLQSQFQASSSHPQATATTKSPEPIIVPTSSSIPISSPVKSTPILSDDKGGENKVEEEKVVEEATEPAAELVTEPTAELVQAVELVQEAAEIPKESEVAAEPDMAKVAEIAAEYAEPSESNQPEVADNAIEPQDQE